MTRLLCLLFLPLTAAAAGLRVAMVSDAATPARYGLSRLQNALQARGFAVESAGGKAAGKADAVVLAGLCTGGRAADALRKRNVALPRAPEALVIRTGELAGKPGLILCGADARGLEYAALEAADRVSWSTDPSRPFAHVRDISEQPYIRERAVSMYTMQRAYFERRLYDEAHWQRYFDLLAASRINRFVVIFGYENGGFMAPPYPYFFDVPQFPDVSLVGLTEEQQKRNVAAFRAMMRAAHERGIDFAVAIWDHIYRGGVQSGGIEGASALAGKRVPGLVWGVTAENLAPYTKAAIRKLLEIFPEIDGLQLRMHGESGLQRGEMEGFWHQVFTEIKRVRPGLPVELRAKDLPDSIIEDGLRQGLRVRVSTKFWMEQMGEPFHPTHVNKRNQHDRRHGYADLLRYPQTYKVHWQLWSGGTTRLLLWADPEYVRRFAGTARLYRGDSFDVNEMLATKMLGEPHDAAPVSILNSRYRYYDYEFERYWHFYQLWGRLTYNPDTPAETWEREFSRRFGDEAGKQLMAGLHLASRVLPRIVAASYPYHFFPTTRGWAEMMRMDDVPRYAAEHTTDIGQFLSARDYARSALEGKALSARSPEETSRWFARVSEQILSRVSLAEKAAGAGRSNEFLSTATDLRILSGLARYHSHRLRSAVSYSFFKESGDAAALDDAIESERAAVGAWEGIVEAAADVYSHRLPFGVQRAGFSRHWKEELEKLRGGLAQLEKERGQSSPAAKKNRAERRAAAEGEPPQVRLDRPPASKPGEDLRITARVADPSGIGHVRLHYRHLTQYEDYRVLEMKPGGEAGLYEATIPGSFIVPQWDLMYFVEAQDTNGNGRLYPDLDIETPYVIVPLAAASASQAAPSARP